jgi:hypothetical protein
MLLLLLLRHNEVWILAGKAPSQQQQGDMADAAVAAA